MYGISSSWGRGHEVLLRPESDEYLQLPWKKNQRLLQTMYALLLGQVVSFLLAWSSFFSRSIVDYGVNVPLTHSFINYVSLLLVFGTIRLRRRQNVRVSWVYYLYLGFVDVHGSYLVKKACQYSSLARVTLLDCWTIPWTMILSWLVLGTRYSMRRVFGAALCIGGFASGYLSVADMGGGESSKPILGDTLVMAGTLFVALSNVGEEFCVKKKDSVEVVAMIGGFGALICAFEIYMLELATLRSIVWSPAIVLGFVGHAITTFSLHSLLPFLLKMSGATMFNLSLLTSDLWTVIIRIYFYHQKVDWVYYISFATVAAGLLIYSKEYIFYTLSRIYFLITRLVTGVPIMRLLRSKPSLHITKS